MNTVTTTFRKSLIPLLLGFVLAGSAFAGSDKDGRVTVKPVKDDRYQVDGYTFGKAELFGYLSELKETSQITGIVLKDGNKKASDEQRKSVASIGNTLQLETFTQDGKDIQPLAME